VALIRESPVSVNSAFYPPSPLLAPAINDRSSLTRGWFEKTNWKRVGAMKTTSSWREEERASLNLMSFGFQMRVSVTSSTWMSGTLSSVTRSDTTKNWSSIHTSFSLRENQRTYHDPKIRDNSTNHLSALTGAARWTHGLVHMKKATIPTTAIQSTGKIFL
jgi:hypothetical protein